MFAIFQTWSPSDWGIWAQFCAQATLLVTIIVGVKQLRADHTRSRRERTLEVMEFWSSRTIDYASELFSVRHIVCHLEKRQCEDLWRAEPLRVNVKHKIHILRALKIAEGNLIIEGSDILLPPELTLRLREITAYYLNILETVFFAWRHHIADRKLIAEEFGALIAPPDGSYPLEEMTCATGKYPSIRHFLEDRQGAAKERKSSKPLAA